MKDVICTVVWEAVAAAICLAVLRATAPLVVLRDAVLRTAPAKNVKWAKLHAATKTEQPTAPLINKMSIFYYRKSPAYRQGFLL